MSLTYAGGLLVIQLVAVVTDAVVALGCVVAKPLTTNMRTNHTLVHFYRETGGEKKRACIVDLPDIH